MKVFWTKSALYRLQEIEEYISKDNSVAAVLLVDKLVSLSETLCDNPQKGRIVPELSINKVRKLIHKNYRLVYLVKKNSIDILTVFEGHQLLKKEEIAKAATVANQGKVK
ncbi:MAG: type II toxin-antitoxin system RelE/ParE family toxin [Ignavibacteria bacterium]|nr:type II toxin-antitoxin system RelE/ParE family toxin [Ignavibacteria bacterium]